MVDIVHRIGIRAPATRVYEAVATVNGVTEWWTRDASGTATKGGTVDTRFVGPDGRELGRISFEMHSLDPGRRVCWRFTDGPCEWLGTEATFELAEAGEMTIVTFGHRSWTEPVEFMAHCSMKWAVFLWSLRELVETGKGRPAPEDIKIDNWN